MNLPTVPTIPETIMERAKHPAYGYFETSDEYFDAIIRWHKTHNGITGLEKNISDMKMAFSAASSRH